MASQSIVDNTLFIHLDLDHSLRANSYFQTNVAKRAHLASQLLLYDTVIIPTIDFGIIPILINWFGLKGYEAILESSSLKFIRRNGILGYLGNGNGISSFIIKPGESKPLHWWQDAIFGESCETSIEIQLKHMCPFVPKKQRQRFTDLIASQSTVLDYDNEFFMKNIVNESYTDIMNNEHLYRFISAKAKGRKVKLNWLDGVSPDSLRVLGQEGQINDAVDLVLRIAEINMEIVMATATGNADIYTSDGAEKILGGKLSRSKLGNSLLEGFVSLLELSNIPDIRQAVMSDTVDLIQIWSLREKSASLNGVVNIV